MQTPGATLILKPNTGTATFTVTTSGEQMTAITGTVTVTEGTGTIPEAESLTPKLPQTVAKVELVASRFDSGENWTNSRDFKYNNFTEVIPKTGDKLTFQIRGTVDKPLNWFNINLCSHIADGSNYKWYGNSSESKNEKGEEVGYSKIPNSFDETLVITIVGPTHGADSYKGPPSLADYNDMYLEFNNWLWGKYGDGPDDYYVNSGTKLPKDAVPYITVMATIRNMEVRLVSITPATP